MNIKFRKMNDYDRNEVIEMMKLFYNTPAVHTSGSEEIFKNDFDNCVGESPYLEGYIFEDEGQVCGYSMLAKSFSTEFGKPCIWIEDIYIKESRRNRGIGKKFFDFISDKYKDAVFRLEVKEDNKAAVNLYKKEGYDVLPYIEMKK